MGALTDALAMVRTAAIVLASLAACAFVGWMLSSCGAHQCRDVAIVTTAHPTKPRPAGKVRVDCNGKVLLEVDAENVH